MRLTLINSAVVLAAAAILTLAPVRRDARPARAAAESTAKSALASSAESAAKLEIPASVRRDHAELHERLDRAAAVGGDTGASARKVASLLYPHLAREEQFALPPLGMLRAFSHGEVPAHAEQLIALTERFRAEYPRMLEEHEAIVGAVGDLLIASRAEGHDDVSDFARSLLHHAQSEEEVLYPTTILIGEYVKLMVAKDSPAAPGVGGNEVRHPARGTR